MSSETQSIAIPQQQTLEKPEVMGVASICSKRRLGNGDVSEESDSPVSKIARKDVFTDPYSHAQDTIVHETSSSDFLTTSILARTLLTGSGSSHHHNHHESLVHVPISSPLDSLKSSLEAMPAPAFMESLHERFQAPTPIKATIEESTELEFTNLLCHETSLATVTILSPIDEDSSEWRSTVKRKGHSPSSLLTDQVITEDENGKSYFNLGPSDATILAKKSSSNCFATSDQSWLNANGGEIDLMDDTSSSSSCDSISSEDLFNSCEEFDASDDEEEVRTYKQERSTVLHLSLCKLNMFRTHCLEPSLRRSVLICNTLRHIEQEIRSEDEVKGGGTCVSLESRETLPPFWPNGGRNSNHHSHHHHHHRSEETLPVPDMNAQGHDPYLSSNSYTNDSPYTSYDYNSLRPSQTPFHAASYDDYPESELSGSVNGGPSLTELVSSPPALLECDSGYAEDLELSSYYYGTSSSPNEFSTASVLMDVGTSTTTVTTTAPYCPEIPVETVTSAVESSNSDINSTTTTIATSVEVENHSAPSCGKYLDVEVATSASDNNLHCWPCSSDVATAAAQHYAQQEGQCGLESMRSDYGGYGHQQLPMDSLVSATYSSLS